MFSPQKKAASYNKSFTWRYPLRAEKELYSIISGSVKKVTNRIDTLFIEYGKQFDSNNKTDDELSDMMVEINYVYLQVMKSFEDDKILGIPAMEFIKDVPDRIYENNNTEMERFLSLYLSAKLPIYDYSEKVWKSNFALEIRNKLRILFENYFIKIRNLYRKETNVGKMLNKALELGKTVSKGQPLFISRDMTGSYNAMNQARLFNLTGFDMYFWSTMMDERVRGRPDGMYPKHIPSHWDMQGLICKLSNPSIFSTDGIKWQQRYGKMPKGLAPGEDYNCRCTAVPYINTFLQKADNII
jgi:hypothetical protein